MIGELGACVCGASWDSGLRVFMFSAVDCVDNGVSSSPLNCEESSSRESDIVLATSLEDE